MSALAEALARQGWSYYFEAENWQCILCGLTEDGGREEARRDHFIRCVERRYAGQAHVVVDDLRMAMFVGASIASGAIAV